MSPRKCHDDGDKKQDYIHSVFLSRARSHSHRHTHFRSMHSMIHQSSGVCSCITPAEAECYFWATARLCSQARNMQRRANIVASLQIHAHRKTNTFERITQRAHEQNCTSVIFNISLQQYIKKLVR